MPKPQTARSASRKARIAFRGNPFEIVTGRQTRLYVPHRSRHVPASAWTDYHGPTPEAWKALAHVKGFRIHRRIRDRLHVALECRSCGSLTAQRVYTLRTAQPRCGGCAEAGLVAQARAAGLVFLRRDGRNHHYALYRAACGHVIRRQFEFVARVVASQTDPRCERCVIAREKAEARRQGWERLRRDPVGNPNYRLYRHTCGQVQRVARVNMAWRQCKCAACGDSWNARASFIYLLRIELADVDLNVLKLGFSRTPVKRFRHQLGLSRAARVQLVRALPMATGHAACTAERRAHRTLRQGLPDAVVPPDAHFDLVNTKSEIYAASAFDAIMRLMDEIEAAHPAVVVATQTMTRSPSA